MQAQSWQTLIDATELAGHLGGAGWVVVDCRFDLSVPEAGEHAYRLGHVPGAVYAHLDRDLSGPRTVSTGRHPLPEVTEVAERLRGWGIGPHSQVVAYDSGSGAFASRLWWLLRWVGHERVAVLDGGLEGWRAAGYHVSAERSWPVVGNFSPSVGATSPVAAEVLLNDRQGQLLVVDARSRPRYRGEHEPIDPVAGHIPGARNHPFEENLAADERFLDAGALREHWSQLLGGHVPEAVVHMCGSGVTACHNMLSMEHAGLHGSRLYAGSWSEWITDPQRPVAVGDE